MASFCLTCYVKINTYSLLSLIFFIRILCRRDSLLTHSLSPMESLPEELILKLCGYTIYALAPTLQIVKNRLRLSLLCKEYRNLFLSDHSLFCILLKVALEQERAVHKVVELFMA